MISIRAQREELPTCNGLTMALCEGRKNVLDFVCMSARNVRCVNDMVTLDQTYVGKNRATTVGLVHDLPAECREFNEAKTRETCVHTSKSRQSPSGMPSS